SGLLAGLLSLKDSVTALSPEDSATLMASLPRAATTGPLDDGDDGAAPWHDQTMPLPERLKLAEGRPLRRRMMAGMGQQDCGQWGYIWEEYSNAIFLRSEERLNLCVPGGKETQRALKKLYEDLGVSAPAAAASLPGSAPPPLPVPAAAPGRSRDHPVMATLV